MAGIITIAKGHDASYPWKQIGAAEPGKAATNSGKGVGYYLSPAEKGGEPPGIWTGKAGAELGLQPGGTVDRQVFERLYGQHLDPRDPSGETRLGRAPGQYKTVETIHAAMLAAEPEATAERRAELMIEAKAQVRTPDLYWDATFSVSKSISLFHASALANAAAAAQRGDLESVQAWEDVADGIWDAIMEGNAAALDYLQREAGQTRAGYHPGGRWEDARAWVIASFRQHTSRDGDPQLHVHNLILHKVRRESDGAVAGAGLDVAVPAPPRRVRDRRPRRRERAHPRFGVRWIPRADGHGREIAGVGQALMDMFSSRRRSIGPLTARLAQASRRSSGARPTHARSRACASGPTTPPGAARTPDRSTSRRWCASGRRTPAPARRARSNPSRPPSWAPAPLPPPRSPSTKTAGASAHRAADRTPDSAPHPGSDRRGADGPADLDRSRPDPPPRRAPPRTRRRDERARCRRAAARPGPPGPGQRGGRAVGAGMAARAGLPAPRLGREPVHPARRDPLRHQRAAHPGRAPARPGAGEPAPRACSPRPRRAFWAQTRRISRRKSRRKHPLKTCALNGSRRGCAWIRPPRPTVLTSARRAEVMAGPAGSGRPAPSPRWPGSGGTRAWAR